MQTKHYVGETGTEIIVNCGRNIRSATVHKLSVIKPDGTIVEWDAELHSQYKTSLRYVVQTNDFDQAGEYCIQAIIDMPSWSGRGETAKFTVYELFS